MRSIHVSNFSKCIVAHFANRFFFFPISFTSIKCWWWFGKHFKLFIDPLTQYRSGVDNIDSCGEQQFSDCVNNINKTFRSTNAISAKSGIKFQRNHYKLSLKYLNWNLSNAIQANMCRIKDDFSYFSQLIFNIVILHHFISFISFRRGKKKKTPQKMSIHKTRYIIGMRCKFTHNLRWQCGVMNNIKR